MNAPTPTTPPGNPLIGYWKLVVLERYAKFEGRAGRAEYWWFFLANLIIGVVLQLLGNASSVFSILYLVYILALLCPHLAVGVRRLHDTGRSGWYLLLALIPCVGTIILIVMLATEGTPEQNKYGPAS